MREGQTLIMPPEGNLRNSDMNDYGLNQDIAGDNKKIDGDQMETEFQPGEELNATIDLEFLNEQNQENGQFKEDECGFQSKEKELKEKLMLVTMKMEKNKNTKIRGNA